MKSFSDFWNKLTENSLWFEQITVKYSRKGIKNVGEKFFIDLLARPDELKTQNFELWRRQFQKWLIYEPDAPVKINMSQGEPFKESENFLVGEERQKRITEFLNILKEVPATQPIPKITNKQIAEEGQWVPKSDRVVRSKDDMMRSALDHMETVRTAKEKEFRALNPTATQEELNEYLDSIEFNF